MPVAGATTALKQGSDVARNNMFWPTIEMPQLPMRFASTSDRAARKSRPARMSVRNSIGRRGIAACPCSLQYERRKARRGETLGVLHEVDFLDAGQCALCHDAGSFVPAWKLLGR